MYRVMNKIVCGVILGGLLTSCALTPMETRDTSVAGSVQQEMERSVETNTEAAINGAALTPEMVNALLPPLIDSTPTSPTASDNRFDVYVEQLDAHDFFRGLVQDTTLNMVVHPSVTGTISLNLTNVTVDDVLSITKDIYGYPYKKKGNVYQVLPAGMRSEIFRINYLNLKRRGVSETRVTNGQVTNASSSNTGNNSNSSNNNENNPSNSSRSQGVTGTQIQTTTEADFWSELKSTLTLLIGSGEGRQVVVTPQAGIVAVRAHPEEIDLVRDYLQHAELIMRRQVVLEAKILEIELNDGYQSGVNWAALGRPGNNNTIAFGVDSNSVSSTDGGLFSLSYDLGDFFGVIELLQTQGSVQVLSSPRISTVNNQKAVIKVGTDEFFVTEISNTTTTSTGTTTNNPEVELTPFFSGIALDVTPQISESDEIILHIHPSISEVRDQVKIITLGDDLVELPLALSTIRETDSIVSAKSGQVIVLGGLMQNRSSDVNSGAPGLRNLPFLGHLFSTQKNTMVKSELVILLKPTIINGVNDTDRFDVLSERFLELNQHLK